MKERIEKIIESFSLSPSRFADELGIQRSGISHVLSGRNKPSLEFIQKVLSRYPEISSDWLVQGIGPMKKEWNDPNQISLFDVSEIPVVPESLKASVLSNSIESPAIEMPEQVEKKEYYSHLISEDPIKTEKPEKEPAQPSAPTFFQPLNNTVNPLSAEKRIERIVIFYSDKTFAEYKHE